MSNKSIASREMQPLTGLTREQLTDLGTATLEQLISAVTWICDQHPNDKEVLVDVHMLLANLKQIHLILTKTPEVAKEIE